MRGANDKKEKDEDGIYKAVRWAFHIIWQVCPFGRRGGYVFTMSSYAFSGKERAELFVSGWRFHLGNPEGDASRQDFDDGAWRLLDLPHDWSIEGDFSADHPARKEGGALPGGLGWYRKVFEAPREWRERKSSWILTGCT